MGHFLHALKIIIWLMLSINVGTLLNNILGAKRNLEL